MTTTLESLRTKAADSLPSELLHTVVSAAQGIWATRLLVASLLPTLKWRRHGIGALQAYVYEHSDRELRVHLWSPRLVVPGILESGNAHNHRFAMRSQVLIGTLLHTEWQLRAGGGHELCNVFDFKHARLHKTDDDRTELSAIPGEVAVDKRSVMLQPGAEYTFERGAYHDSMPLSDVVVTLVEKFDQREERARVIAPAGKPPVPAFGLGEPASELVAELVSLAVAELRAHPTPEAKS
jgi:hypothetical protein